MSDRVEIRIGIFGNCTIRYACPNCSTRLASPVDDAGGPDTCPDCGKPFVVPGVTERDRIRRVEAESNGRGRETAESVVKRRISSNERKAYVLKAEFACRRLPHVARRYA
jgi:DNA-directed RNA polymerase subunit RPC12/RpoP